MVSFTTFFSSSPQAAGLIRYALNALMILMLINFLSFILPSAFYAVIALLVFGVYVIALARLSPAAFVLLLTYIFFRLTTLLSGVGIEYGSEMPELDLWGEATGGTIRLTMVYVFFITVAAVVIEYFYYYISRNGNNKVDKERGRSQLWIWILLCSIAVVTLMVLAIGAQAGYPVLTGESRLAFREEVNSKVFLLYSSNRIIFVVLLGLVISTTRGYLRKCSIACFLLIIFVALLFGEKFTPLISMSIFLLVPVLLLNKNLHSLKITRLGVILFFISICTVPVILSVYGWSEDPDAAVERLMGRFAGQGQLWFVADRDMSAMFQFDLDALQHNLKSFFVFNAFDLSNEAPYFGAKYFMFNYMSDGLLFLFLETQALTLTFAFEPYLLATNGWLGQLIPLFICAVIYGLTLAYLMFGIFKVNPISVFLAMKLFIWMNVSIQQGELWFMFGIKTIILISVCFVYEFLFSKRRIKFI